MAERPRRLTMVRRMDLANATAPSFADVGAAFYFVPETVSVGKAVGLNGFQWYLLGRGGVLGDVDADVVSSAFGYFNPPTVRGLWDAATAVMPPREAGARYHRCAADFGSQRFAGIDGLDAFNDAAEAVIAAAHPGGLALFAAIAAESRVDDPAGRAMQLACVIREFRGSAHLAAVVASGVHPAVAHYIKRPEMWRPFGYDEASPPTVTDADREGLAHAETITDRIVAPAFAALDGAQSDALASGIAAMKAALA
jgi:hypothetical protein